MDTTRELNVDTIRELDVDTVRELDVHIRKLNVDKKGS